MQLYCFLLGNWHRTNKQTLKIIIPSYLDMYDMLILLKGWGFFFGATKYLESPSLRPILSVPSEASTRGELWIKRVKKKHPRKVKTFGQNCPSQWSNVFFCKQKTISSTWWTYIQVHTPLYIIYNYTYYIYIYRWNLVGRVNHAAIIHPDQSCALGLPMVTLAKWRAISSNSQFNKFSHFTSSIFIHFVEHPYVCRWNFLLELK